jgi:hypothetical protein
MDMTTERPSDDKSNGLMNYDKRIALEEILRVVKESV